MTKAKAAGTQTSEADAKLRKALSLIPIIAVLLIAGAALWYVFNSVSGGSPESRCASALLPEWRDSCYYSLALDAMDPSYCNAINDAAKRDVCLSQASAGAHPTETICSKMTGSVLRDTCYSTLAKESKNATYCSMISSPLTAEQCYSETAAAAGDPSICTMIKDTDAMYKCNNDVYQQLALERGDPRLCQHVDFYDAFSKQLIADNCVLAVSMNRSDKSMCRYIVNDTIRARCMGLSVSADCESFDANQRNICYYSSAVANKNQNECGKITVESLRNNCYYQIATQKMDPAICESISSESLKQLCLTAAGKK